MPITSIRIHPAIGIARLGNSPEFFIGPEEPGQWSPPPGGTYKDALCRVKKQAARFRLFAFDGTTFVKELKDGDPEVEKIEWTVELVNRKAASHKFSNFNSPAATDPSDVYPASGATNWRNSGVATRDQLVIDPGAKTLDGPNQAAGFNTGTVMGVPVPLGEMRTQADGALIVLGGWGHSGSFNGQDLQTFADNDGWYDDVSDGPVTAKVTLTGGATPAVAPAWVIVGPPKFAPAIQPMITLYDTALHAWEKAHPGFDPGYSIAADVKPFYERLLQHIYLNETIQAHSFNASAFPAAGSALAKSLFNFLNDPASPSSDPNDFKMPRLWSSSNEKNGAVTPLQYKMFKRWAGPNDASNPALPASSPPLAVYEKLDRAALEACIGGNLYPGIEASWWMLDKFKYTAPFRLDHTSLKAGDVTSQMAVPWQSDFSACYFYSDYAWWPAQRPDQVTRGGSPNQSWHKDFGDSSDRMVATWHKLGFVVPEGNVQVEKERTAVCLGTFIVTDRNEFAMDEVDAVLSGGSPALFTEAFYVMVEGFTPQDLGFTSPNPANLDAIAPVVTFLMPNSSPAGHMKGKVETALLQNALTERQRITFQYRVEFDGLQDFTDGMGDPIEVQDLTLRAQIKGLTATAPVRLLNKPNPYMTDGGTAWLSKDLRVFQVVENTEPFPGIQLAGNDAAAARAFIVKVIEEFNKPILGTHPFDNISVDQAKSKLELSTSVGGKRVFNFAVARVRYKAKTLDAKDVRVFFRMFTTAATGLEYRPNETYRTFASGSGAISLLGLQAGDIVTVPFFAAQRETVQDMTFQTDPKNVMDLKASGTKEFHGYFGCWLDFNQKDEFLYPLHPSPPNGPFAAGKKTIQELIRGKHQCLVAEVFYPPDTIPAQATPASSDQLAQRNLMIVESDNPGDVDSHTVTHPFLIGARRTPRQLTPAFFARNAVTALPPVDAGVDELMIRWGNLPRKAEVQVYIPGISADDLLHQAGLGLDDPAMERVDDYTVRLRPADVSFLPIPPEAQGRPVPGLLRIVVPDTVRVEQFFRVVVHQISGVDRRIVGTFQLSIPVSTGEILLPDEMRLYSVMLHIFNSVPQETPWFPVMAKYLKYLASRVRAFGGNPERVEPSPDGGEGGRERPEKRREEYGS